MIRSFGDRRTEELFHGVRSRRVSRIPSTLIPATLRKLDMLNAAHVLDDLRVPPGSRLEALVGDLRGCHSIRVNQQWRLVFRWAEGGPHEVRLIDSHRG